LIFDEVTDKNKFAPFLWPTVYMCFCCVRFSFSIPRRDWLGERLQNDLFCVEWDV